jgi:hypothetical protein
LNKIALEDLVHTVAMVVVISMIHARGLLENETVCVELCIITSYFTGRGC